MRLTTFLPPGSQTPRAGQVRGDEVVSFVMKRETVLERLRTGDHDPALGDAYPLADVTLLAPVPRPRAIFGIGLNYAAHAAEQGKELPEFPIVFMKLPSSSAPPNGPVTCPAVVKRLDYEGELAIVMGADGFCPWGPWITTADEVPDPESLQLTTHVNGELRQDSSTSDLVFGPQELVDFISQTCTLEPGDLILTGTPSGVGMSMDPRQFLAAGDVVRIEIESLGAIEHVIA